MEKSSTPTEEEEENTSDTSIISPIGKKTKVRNLCGFWILGLCNNYAYVIMLSAAFDLLKPKSHEQDHQVFNASNTTTYNPISTVVPNVSNTTRCNPISTGAILLADILPSFLIKLLSPFIAINTHVRVTVTIILSAMSFIITSFSVAHWMTFLGVICASLSSGLGEVTFLSYSSYFDKNVVSTWSSGTGGAGVIGALSYASLKHGLSTKDTLLVMLVIPVLMTITFWLLIEHPRSTKCHCNVSLCSTELDPMLGNSIDLSKASDEKSVKVYSLKQKIALLQPLLKYMIPLAVVYFAEYFINQGLMELLYFQNAEKWLVHEEQYRWYQVDYQIGVLISRSSVNFLQVKRLWILPILQLANLTFLLFEAYYLFLPSIWIVIAIIFYEGLLGGCAYVNTFYRISSEISPEDKEFSMGVASLGDSIGIAMAGIISLPVHDALCRTPLHML